MKLSRYLLVVLAAVVSMLSIGCSGPAIKDIPGGYVGIILTPSGWDGQIREAGQVDIGAQDMAGRGNTLVLIESTSKTIKETFVKSGEEDHRMYTKDLTMPLNADLYFNVTVNVDQDGRISSKAIKYILNTITPQGTGDPRVKTIGVDLIYARLAQPAVRGKARDLFSSYGNYEEVIANQAKVSKEAEGVVQECFGSNHVPMSVVSVQMSNIKPDQDIVAAQTKQVMASSEVQRIEEVGKALEKYPAAGILYIIEAIKANPNAVVIINGTPDQANMWAAAKKYAASAPKQ
jgi:regulator of protease activity HflC (stomatin/prohibitin superfamily)